MKRKDPQRAVHQARSIELAALAENLSARAKAVTVPLYRYKEPEPPESFASGVLLAIESTKFLLTAGHCFDDAVGRDVAAGLPGSLVRIQGKPARFRTPGSPTSTKDHFDVGLVELISSEWDAVPFTSFLGLDEVTVEIPSVPTGSFAVVGYPATKQPAVKGNSVRSYVLPLAAKASPKEVYEALGYEASVNLILGFDKRWVWSKGRLEDAPDPIGMSGGGVWSFGGKIADATTPPLLAGISTEWRRKTKEKGLVSTRMDQILRAIGHKYEKLQQPVGLKIIEAERRQLFDE